MKYLHYHDPHTPFVCFSNKTFLFTRKKERETRNLEEQTFQDVTEIENNFFCPFKDRKQVKCKNNDIKILSK